MSVSLDVTRLIDVPVVFMMDLHFSMQPHCSVLVRENHPDLESRSREDAFHVNVLHTRNGLQCGQQTAERFVYSLWHPYQNVII